MRVLVTGAHGFSARYLIPSLAQEHEVYRTDCRGREEEGFRLCDLCESDSARGLVEWARPEQIYHLAGGYADEFLPDFYSNVLTTRNLLEALRYGAPKCRVLLVGSAAEYGPTVEEGPINEDRELQPVTVYGLMKVFQTYLMRFYVSAYHMDIVMARSFNLFGKGAPKSLFVGRLNEQIEEFQSGRIPKIVLGSLSASRDYIDVGEAVKLYRLIMERGERGEVYNVGAGRATTMRHLLDQVLKENGLSMDDVEVDDTRINRPDVAYSCAELSKLRALADRFVKA